MTKVSAFAPATVANVGCAFDVLGFALEAPGDTVSVQAVQTPGVQIAEIDGDGGRLPRDPAANSATVAASALLASLAASSREPMAAQGGFQFSIKKGLPVGSGLGSSSASSAAAVVALNALLGEPFSRRELVPFAMEGERVACGAAHADNVAPALLGGFVLIRSYTPLEIIQLPSPSLSVAIVTPAIELKTSDARRVLPRAIPLPEAIAQWGNVAGLIAGLFTNDHALIGRSLHDHIIEPTRSELIPGYPQAKRAALDAGALGSSISGAGPSLFAFTSEKAYAHRVALAMHQEFLRIGIDATTAVSSINPSGATILSTL
jgi:homoserine kinase